MFLCRKNLVPAAFFVGLGSGLLVSCLFGSGLSSLLGIVLIVIGVILVRR